MFLMSLDSHKNKAQALGVKSASPSSSAPLNVAGKGVIQRPNLTGEALSTLNGKCSQKQDTRKIEKLLLKRRAAGFSLMPSVEQLLAVKLAETCINTAYEYLGNCVDFSKFNSERAESLVRLENLKTEIIRRAMVDATNHKKYYHYET